MKNIYYLGYYDTPDNAAENRNIVLAATNKMSYIIEAMEKAGYGVEVISASQTKNRRAYAEKTVPIGRNSTLHLFKTIPWGNKLRRIFSILHMRHQYQRYILKNIGPEDTLVAYHAVSYAPFLVRAKQKKHFRLVLEVEEIYADVNQNENDRRKEYAVFGAADAFLFPTELLNQKVNTAGKPHTVIYGTYRVEPDRGVGRHDGKIHVVYAGTFDPRKGGARSAVGAGEFLDGRYHIHILGFGSEADKRALVSEIERVSAVSECTVTHDGLLSGEEYIRFLQSCDIGLSTQNPNASFNDTSFPSKILSYMANGLRVVSIRIPVVEASAIGGSVQYYEEQAPDRIAAAIRQAAADEPCDIRTTISALDKQFIDSIQKLLGGTL